MTFRPTHHGPQDYQSLLMHREAVRMILAEPSLADRVLEILARWDICRFDSLSLMQWRQDAAGRGRILEWF